MGGRKETPPTIIMPAEGAPQAFQTIVPQKSYKDIAESTLRTEKEINRLMGQRYDEVGTMQVQTDPAKEAAKKRFDESKKAYEAALEKLKRHLDHLWLRQKILHMLRILIVCLFHR